MKSGRTYATGGFIGASIILLGLGCGGNAVAPLAESESTPVISGEANVKAVSEGLLAQVERMQNNGEFKQAEELIAEALKDATLTPELRRALDFEEERIRRVRLDYMLTADALYKRLSERMIKDTTRAEFDGWVKEGRFDRKVIDGEERFVNASSRNLLFRYPELHERRLVPANVSWENFLLAHCRQIDREFHEGPTPNPMPRHFRITMTNTVDAGAVPAGQTIRTWMVYPQEMPSQTNITLESTTPAVKLVNAPDYPHRSLYFETTSNGDEPTSASATWTMTNYPRRHRIDPELVSRIPQNFLEDVSYFLEEKEPHVVFTPEIRELAKTIVKDETNPAIKARLIYNWISENIKYSYAREYSTLQNISMYCLQNGYGDCGQITLLYMTLCRASGIPARWQSGWVIYPAFQNLHDWCEIYVAPYGWVPVDPNFGVTARSIDVAHLPKEDRDFMHDFYFGSMDAYRMIVNRDHGAEHNPKKEDFRSDTVDFQRGELESGGRNIYFDQFNYRLRLEVLSAPGSEGAKTTSKGPDTPLKPGEAR